MCKNRISLQCQKGVTLVEIMAALVILLPTLLLALYVLMVSQRVSQESRERLLALNAARSTLETIKNTPLPSIPNINTAGFLPAELKNPSITIATNPANLGGQAIATVTVTVNWLGQRNMPRSLQLSTMRSQY